VVLYGSHNGIVLTIAETTGHCFWGADDKEDAQQKKANFFDMDGFDHWSCDFWRVKYAFTPV
jgi:hypothetical protein